MRAQLPMVLAFALFGCSFGPAVAGDLSLNRGLTLQSGETWFDGKARFRLFGVQSCLRGTYFTNDAGVKMDCGDASLAVLAAFIKDMRPSCVSVARTRELSYVVCSGRVGPSQVDLGTALIASGYAFAALDRDGLPASPSYAVAEQQAQKARSGLWRYRDVKHPSLLLGNVSAEGRRR